MFEQSSMCELGVRKNFRTLKGGIFHIRSTISVVIRHTISSISLKSFHDTVLRVEPWENLFCFCSTRETCLPVHYVGYCSCVFTQFIEDKAVEQILMYELVVREN